MDVNKKVDINVSMIYLKSEQAQMVPHKTTLKVRDHCLCLHTQRAARYLTRIFDDAFQPLDLKSGQFSLLMSLNRPQPPSISAVASGLGMDRSTVTANLKPLEKRGLVCVTADKMDRRMRRLSLTPAGQKLLQEATPIWEATHAKIDSHFDDDAHQLRADLARVLKINEEIELTDNRLLELERSPQPLTNNKP